MGIAGNRRNIAFDTLRKFFSCLLPQIFILNWQATFMCRGSSLGTNTEVSFGGGTQC